MHIAFLVPRFYPYRGGYENYSLSLARHLHSAGNRVSVFTTTAWDLESLWLDGFRTVPPGKETYDSIEIHRFPICYRRWRRRATRVLSFVPDWRLRAKYSRPGFAVLGLAEALRAASPDIIHVGPLPFNNLMCTGISEARRRNIPVIATPCTHFGEEQNNDVSRYYVQRFQIKMLNACDIILTLTQIEADKLMNLGVHSRKLRVSGAGIDVQNVTGGDPERIRTKYGIRQPMILHLGMKAYDKGSICVVESMKILWARGVDAHLVLAGPGLSAFDDYLAQQTSHHHRLLNLGTVDEQDKKDLLAAADIVVQPSRVESLGLILLEAWANEKPVIAADIAVSRELVELGFDGLLVPFGDNHALAEAIAKLLQDPESRGLMGEHGKRKVLRSFDANRIVERVSPLFSMEAHVQP